LALDGQRLIKISSNEYRTESESFSKITVKNVKDWGPEVIRVQTKEGLTLEYGKAGDNPSHMALSADVSKIILGMTITSLGKRMGWYLTRVTDNFGNFIKYNMTIGND
jgi:hypothetical protein